jgi:Tfp pilus assembly protein PilF
VVKAKPEYIAARTALADLYVRKHDTADAIGQLQEAAKLDPQSSPMYEKIGDLESGGGNREAAKAAWQQALEHATDKAVRKRLSAKIAGANH